ncbi:MAG: META domain-containing protein [Colwellia sp.]
MKLAQVVILSLSTLLFACSSGPTAEIAKHPLELQALSQQWKLVTVDNKNITTSSTLKIDDQGKASGKLACNNFFGELQLEANKLRIDKMGNSRKMCIPEIYSLEVQVASTLSNWSEAELSGKDLILTGEKHILVYTLN